MRARLIAAGPLAMGARVALAAESHLVALIPALVKGSAQVECAEVRKVGCGEKRDPGGSRRELPEVDQWLGL